MNTQLSRRAFAAGLGTIVVAFSLDPRRALAQKTPLPGDLETTRRLDAWIRINTDGSATICLGKVEFGQGILTTLAQIAAEELDLPLSKLQLVTADTSATPDEGISAGSLSTENCGGALRAAGAEVRSILCGLAAQRLGVAVDALVTRDGRISTRDGRSVGYGELARDADLHRDATGSVAAKPASAYRLVGQSVQRLDIPAKVTGGASFVQDMRPAGMLHGRIVRPPRYAATLDGFDEAAARALPGVVAVVRDGNFLGVVAEREEQAINARTALLASARWSGGRDLPDPNAVHAHLKSLPTQDKVISEKTAAVPPEARRLSATYRKPYVAHASIGPSCALAEFRDSQVTVWTHSQGVFPLRGHLAAALKLPLESVRCIHAQGSGCYGHNGADDVALDAALLARAVPGRPVRLQWMRDDEFAWEPYGPAMTLEVSGAVAGGRIVDWNFELWSNTHSTRPSEPGGVNLLAAWSLAEPFKPGPPRITPAPPGTNDRNAIPLYDFPRQRIVNHLIPEMPVRVSALRTLGAYANVWALESFMDELAAAAGVGPLAFRLAHLSDPRARAVLEAVARRAGWKDGEKGNGQRGRGIAFARYKNQGCYAAVVAEITVDRKTGVVRVPRVFAAADAGLVINPDGLRNQLEGGIIQSTSWTLKESVQFDRTGIRTRDWSGYPILTMSEVPQVEIELLNRPEERAMGSGEATSGPAAAAIANAFAHATGRRLRDLPLTPDRVKAALA